MNWYKLGERRINLETGFWYSPSWDYVPGSRHNSFKKVPVIIFKDDDIVYFDNVNKRDEELRKLDETLENGLHTISEFKLP